MELEQRPIPETKHKIMGTGHVVKKNGEFCKLGLFNGYEVVSINHKKYKVHRLVAQAFLPNPENKPCVNHIDGNKQNNHYKNLEWVTHAENMEHYYRTTKDRTRRVKLKITSDEGEELHFKSLGEASKYFAIDITTMWSASLQGQMWGMKIERIPCKNFHDE